MLQIVITITVMCITIFSAAKVLYFSDTCKKNPQKISIGHKLLMHAAIVFQMMPELKATPMGEIGGNMLQRQFFQMLPTDFTKQDAVKQAQVLGVGLKSLDRWLAKFVQTDDLQHISHGIYRKRMYQTA